MKTETIKNPKRVAAAHKAWKTMRMRDITRHAAAMKAHVSRRYKAST